VFIGHFALSFAAKRATPRVGLAVLFAAASFADLLWPILVALGVEQVAIEPGNTRVTPLNFISYPYSHSLVFLVLWGVLVAWIYQQISGQRGAFLVVAGLVVSHWVLDFVTHRADMPLYPGGPRFGLGLWNSVVGTAIVECSMFAVGAWIYARATRPRDAIGRWAFVGFVAFLLASYAANLTGSPPPSVTALYIVAVIGTAVLLVLAWWIDRHRVAE
jgi:membrane-bound metal-dependent hydrolase YbcI (DUF457 family)